VTLSAENAVARVAAASALEVLESWGRDVSGLTEGVSLSLTELRSSRGRIAWNDFARFLRNVRSLLGSDAALEELGHAIVRAPSWTLPAQIARMAVTPGQYFSIGTRVGAPAIFPCVESHMHPLGGGRFEVDLRIPRRLHPSPEFFRITVGQLRGFTRALNLPDAIVEYEIEPSHARYVVTMPPSETRFGRFRRLVRSFVNAPAAYADLVAMRRELEDRHEAYSRAQRDFERLLDRLPDGAVVHRDGVIVYANPAIARILGYDRPEEMIGLVGPDLVPKETVPKVHDRMNQRDPAPGEPMEIEVFRRDGAVLVVSIEPGQPVELAGKPARLVIVRDLTESRRLEGQVLQADRMAALGTLAAGVAHEINNPLAWLHTSLAVLKKELVGLVAGQPLDGATLARMQAALDASLDGSDRVRTIVQDLRTFSRPDDESVEPVDVREVLRGAARVAAKEIARHANLVEDYGDVHKVLGNTARLGQVFLNLMVNAAQAVSKSEGGANVVRIRTYDAPNGTVVVEVSDSGPGIPQHLLPRIFEPFFTTKHGEGTGLGLAISHRIVSRLGGEIAVESKPGRGTTFRVILPALVEEHASIATTGTEAGPEG
jgi:PAS domain S-box-containing protein